jgi:hypothetical protein
MTLQELPTSAAWRHKGARSGFECSFLSWPGDVCVLQGHTAAIERSTAWAVHYRVSVDHQWRTRRARVRSQTAIGSYEVVLEADGEGRWLVDGQRRAELDGCIDVDLESSVCTNTLPIHRLGLVVGEPTDVPAAYVRASDVRVERLEQRYLWLGDTATGSQCEYEAPALEFRARLSYDHAGLVLNYPGLARRML